MTWRAGFVFLFLLGACGTEQPTASDETLGRTGEDCETTQDCGEGVICVQESGQAAGECIVQCDLSVDQCGAEASCNGVGSLSIGICDEDPPEPQSEEEETAQLAQQASQEDRTIPCRSDAECDAIEAGAICATHEGFTGCTLPCDGEEECDIPEYAGISMDFMTCAPDEGTPGRSACVFDESCASNPLSCVDFGGFPGDIPGF